MRSSIWFGILGPPALIVVFAIAYLLLPLREWGVVLIGVAGLVALLATVVELVALPFAIRTLRRNPSARSVLALFGVTSGFISLALTACVLASIFRANYG